MSQERIKDVAVAEEPASVAEEKNEAAAKSADSRVKPTHVPSAYPGKQARL